MPFAADVATLRGIVGTTSIDDDMLTHDLNVAVEMVDKYVGDIEVPAEVITEAVLAVAAEKFNQRKAPNGVKAGAFINSDGSAAPIRISRDPMTPAYPILAQWCSSTGWVG